ncbi:MAG: RNA polymerase sigma factor [Paludibacteraceae bacterium]
MVKTTDKQLIEAICQKKETAFNEFYERYYRLLYDWAFRRTGDFDMTDEITQNFWISIWSEPGLLKTDADGSANKFLLHHFTYRMLDYLKSSYVKTLSDKNRVLFEEIENELINTSSSEEYDIQDFERVITEILHEMPGKMAEIFILHHREGYTIRETAEKLQMNERTVKYKSKECMSAVKKILEDEEIHSASFRVVQDATSVVVYVMFLSDKMMQ